VTSREPDRSLLWPAILVGAGVAGTLDEVVLHQLLRWHHFYEVTDGQPLPTDRRRLAKPRAEQAKNRELGH